VGPDEAQQFGVRPQAPRQVVLGDAAKAGLSGIEPGAAAAQPGLADDGAQRAVGGLPADESLPLPQDVVPPPAVPCAALPRRLRPRVRACGSHWCLSRPEPPRLPEAAVCVAPAPGGLVRCSGAFLLILPAIPAGERDAPPDKAVGKSSTPAQGRTAGQVPGRPACSRRPVSEVCIDQPVNRDRAIPPERSCVDACCAGDGRRPGTHHLFRMSSSGVANKLTASRPFRTPQYDPDVGPPYRATIYRWWEG
jgi:hypothetical protein